MVKNQVQHIYLTLMEKVGLSIQKLFLKMVLLLIDLGIRLIYMMIK